MSMHTTRCPGCRRLRRYETGSARTIATCEGCGLRYELPEPILDVKGWLGLIGAVLVLGSCVFCVAGTFYDQVKGLLTDDSVAEDTDTSAATPPGNEPGPVVPTVPTTAPGSAGFPAPSSQPAGPRQKANESARARPSGRRPQATPPHKPERERLAQIRLDLIKQLITAGKTDIAATRLDQLIADFPATKAAEEARRLRKELQEESGKGSQVRRAT